MSKMASAVAHSEILVEFGRISGRIWGRNSAKFCQILTSRICRNLGSKLYPKFGNFQIPPQILVLPKSDKSKIWPNYPKFCPNFDPKLWSNFQQVQIRPQNLPNFGQNLAEFGTQIGVEFGRGPNSTKFYRKFG